MLKDASDTENSGLTSLTATATQPQSSHFSLGRRVQQAAMNCYYCKLFGRPTKRQRLTSNEVKPVKKRQYYDVRHNEVLSRVDVVQRCS